MNYTYVCCIELEVKHSIKDEPVITCPFCGNAMKIKITHTDKPVLKCGGFYETDYKKGEEL